METNPSRASSIYPAWTNDTVSGASFTAKTAEMESESDYPGVATLGYLNYASSGQNNWLVQEPFYVDVTFYDEDGTTALGVERTLLGAAPAWTGATPTKPSTAQDDYAFAGWSTDGSTVVDLATLRADGPMSLRAVYTSVLRSYAIEWQESTVSTTYAFAGWSTDGTTVLADLTVAADTDFIAVYTPSVRRYAVSFLDWDESVLSALAYDYGTPSNDVAIPADPTRPATAEYTYAFAGWDAPVSNVVGAATYTAVYTTNRFTITWANGNETTSAKYDYLTPTNALAVPEGKKSTSSKASYVFLRWDPELEPVQSNTTYTAMFQGTILAPMTLRYVDAYVESDLSRATVSATLGDYSTPAVGFSAGIGAALRTQTAVLGETATGTASVDEPPAVVASFSALRAAKGYDWTLMATQWVATANMADVAVLHGRFYAKPPRTWFTPEEAVFGSNGVFRPTIPSAAGQQVRLHATMTFPTIPSRVHPDATGAVTGIDVWQPNAGWPLAYYAWNGAKWVRLKGAIAKLGEPVELLGVIDFAIRGGDFDLGFNGTLLLLR